MGYDELSHLEVVLDTDGVPGSDLIEFYFKKAKFISLGLFLNLKPILKSFYTKRQRQQSNAWLVLISALLYPALCTVLPCAAFPHSP